MSQIHCEKKNIWQAIIIIGTVRGWTIIGTPKWQQYFFQNQSFFFT